jgi:hypothetical protein
MLSFSVIDAHFSFIQASSFCFDSAALSVLVKPDLITQASKKVGSSSTIVQRAIFFSIIIKNQQFKYNIIGKIAVKYKLTSPKIRLLRGSIIFYFRFLQFEYQP